MSRRRVVIAFVALWACMLGDAAENAGATTAVRIHAETAGSVAWYGPNAVTTTYASSGLGVLSIDPTTGVGTSLATLAASPGEIELAASPELLGLQRTSVYCPGEPGCKYQRYALKRDEIVALTSTGPPSCVASLTGAGCGRLGTCLGTAPVLVSENALAFRECNSDGTRTTVLLRAGVRTPVPQIAFPLALSWPWLAGLSPGWDASGFSTGPAAGAVRPTLVERNLLTGAEPVRVPLESGTSLEGTEKELPGLAGLDEDGTLFFTSNTHATGGNSATLSVASPAEPTPRQIASVSMGRWWTGAYQPRLVAARGKVAIAETVGVGSTEERRIRVYGLDGTVLGSLPFTENTFFRFDFDGETLVGLASPCGVETFLETWSPGQDVPQLPEGECPEPRVRLAPVVGAEVRASFSCPSSPPFGCLDNSIGVSVPGSGFHRESSQVDLLPGVSRQLSVSVSARARRWLRRHRRARLKVSLYTDRTSREVRLRLR
jgi:hypothetical protein